ncbi:MAG: MarC family protein, partial [Henriciella sp.]
QLHISIDAFRMAGGALLFLIALDMVFERRTERREHRVETVLADQEERPSEPEDVSVFPIGIPMLAGPGSIATAMLYMSNETNIVAQAVILSAIALNLLLCMVIFLMAGPLMRFLGDSISAATTRILGVILSALSVQLLVDGIRGAFNLA